MDIRLHANATTTPKTRRYIQTSSLSVRELALELGVNETTIRRWKKRQDVTDRPHTRHHLGQKTTPEEEEIIEELRGKVGLSIDDITEVMRRCVNPSLSKDCIYRCVKRRGVQKGPLKEESSSQKGVFEETLFGYVHVDLKHLPKLTQKASYVFVAIERVTRFVYVEIIEQRDAQTVAACLKRFLASFKGKVHTILTDNGAEFTDRFAVDKKGKPEGKPSGSHPFDRVCKTHQIQHKLTKPFSPQTNGMVERFNRRLSEAIASKPFVQNNQGKNKFTSPSERNQFILTFVSHYNRTRLRCLNYHSPLEVLSNQTHQNTEAGVPEMLPFLKN